MYRRILFWILHSTFYSLRCANYLPNYNIRYGTVSDFLSTGCFMFADDIGSSAISQAKHKVDMSFDTWCFLSVRFRELNYIIPTKNICYIAEIHTGLTCPRLWTNNKIFPSVILFVFLKSKLLVRLIYTRKQTLYWYLLANLKCAIHCGLWDHRVSTFMYAACGNKHNNWRTVMMCRKEQNRLKRTAP